MNMEDKKRRKSKAGSESSSSKKKKDREPQRGMGVASLERLRVQENLKQMAQVKNLPLNVFMESSMPHQEQHPGLVMNSNVVVPGVHFPPSFEGIISNNKVGVGHFCGDQALFVQRIGGFSGLSSGKNSAGGMVGFSSVGLSLGSSNVKYEAPNNFSPTPSPPNFWGFSDKCGSCYKKKRVDGNKVPNQSHQVEVVAVHRKGGPCGGGVMMEYEFFPEKGGGGDRNSPSSPPLLAVAEECMMRGGAATAYNSISATTISNRSTGGAGVENSSSIDLSLKLY